MNWKELYNEAVHSLSEAGIEESKSEADIIFEYCFKMNKLDIILRGQEKPPESSKSKLGEIIAERKKGIPIQYILGEWNFRNLRFKVGEGVLIPRDDTNILVDVAIEFLNSKKSPCVIDLCSGSGCVALACTGNLRRAIACCAWRWRFAACAGRGMLRMGGSLQPCSVVAAFGLFGNVLVQAAGAIAVGVDGHVGKPCIVYALG